MYSSMLDGMTKLKAESSCEILAKTISNYIVQQQVLLQGTSIELHVEFHLLKIQYV